MESGEFDGHISKDTPISPPFVDHKGQQCVRNQEILILDRNYPQEHHRHEVARVHRFITDQGTVGASGMPDPKEMMLGDNNYRKRKEDHDCELCESGDMISPNERFYGSTYRTKKPLKDS